MKKFVLFGFLSLSLASQAVAGLLVNISIDELGNGTTDFPSTVTHPLPNVLFQADPSGGVAGNVLMYQLPFVTVPGDVHLNESAVASVTSDVARFFNVGNVGFLIFYSDNGDGIDALADFSGLPGNSSTNVVTVLEVGSGVRMEQSILQPRANRDM